MKFQLSHKGVALITLAILVISALIAPFLYPYTARAAKPDPVTAAWAAVRAAGSYHFTSDVTQITMPLATLANVGRASRTAKFYLEGQNDLRAQNLAFTLWSQEGSALNPASGLSIRNEGGKTFARRAEGAWQAVDDITGSLAPQGDFLSYLAAIKDVQAHPSESRGGIDFTRYTFTIDSPRFAASMHQQMEAALRAKGELPPGIQLAVPAYFRDMVGAGELWVGNDGLPLRQLLTLQFPAQEDEQVNTQIVVNFSQIGVPLVGGDQSREDGWRATLSQWHGVDFPAVLTANLLPALFAFALSACALALIYYRHTCLLQTTLVVLVICAQVVGPLLSMYTNVKYVDAQRAKAAAQQERQAEAQSDQQIREALGEVAFNPHRSRLEAGETRDETGNSSTEASLQSPVSSLQSAPALQTVDTGLDTDGDGLTDFVEERIGASVENVDGDGDGLNDKVEVDGFSLGGQQWYTDPDRTDSNGDSLADGVEWGLNSDGSLRSAPLDTDGDGSPDLFDNDNDNDRVPDNKDLAPFTKGVASYNETTPLQLTLNNLTPDKPTFVEFQLRPQDEKQLWFAFNTLDWPQDNAGQVRDVDGKSYADVAVSTGRAADPSEAHGDLKVIPMLEIRLPATSANLPAQAELTPFNITVNDLTADGQTKVAYLPLSVVTDEKSGQRVAFSGQMRYLPTGSWATPHQVRLVWVVQALVDLPCDKALDNSADCQADGIRNNVPQMVQSYYSDWRLTGLTVREEHGTDLAIVYEDPAVDDNLADDGALWALTHVLDRHFTVARDTNNDNRRDLTVADLASRFDRDNNPSAADRMEVPNRLQVERRTYTTLDQAVAATTMTETTTILNNVFLSPVTNDRQLKPLLLFAQEQRTRQLSLSLALAGGGYVTQNGASLTLDMAPSGATAMTVDTVAGVKWMGYCAPDTGAISLTPCDDDLYWQALESRYAALPAQPEDQSPDWMAGRLQFAQLYYTSLRSGYYATVQTSTRIPNYHFALASESDTATLVRGSLRGLATVPTLAGFHFTLLFPTTRLAEVLNYGAQLRQNVLKAAKSLESLPQSKNTTPFQIQTAQSALSAAKARLLGFRIQAAGAALSVLQVTLQILSFVPEIPLVARGLLGGLSAALNLGITVILPAAMFFRAYSATSFIQLLNGTATISRSMKIGGVVGAVISVAFTWGFFIYGAAEAGLTAGSPALNRAFFEAVAATVVTIVLAILAFNPIGMIVAAVIGIIDFVLNLICSLGVSDLRKVPGQGGACFTLTGTVTNALTKLLYSYDLMVDMGRNDLVITDAPQVALTNPNQGYAVGNALTVQMPITTTAVHKDPDPNNGLLIYPYLYLFSADNLTRSSFQYSLTKSNNETLPVALDQMKSAWQNVREDHKYIASPMYRGELRSTPAALTALPLAQGINATVPFILNMSFAVPAYECWVVGAIPVCYTREFKGANHLPINGLVYDVFPATLDGFFATTTKTDGGLGLAWDAKFGSLRDADGDGLRSFVHNGLDPNDNSADSDNDGLTDAFELERQRVGVALSPIQRDTDNDGLTDLQEIRLGSDPTLADSDNDGLKDGEEVYHQVADETTGAPTTQWAGGWAVTINANSPFTVRVSSDPLVADSDNDGVSDQAERQLAQDANPANRVDNQNRPYHPGVPNTPPLALLVETDDLDGYLAPGQSFRYTNTVIANTAVAPGVLNVSVPTVLGSTPNPLALGFNPLTFSTSQTVTQAINLTVAPGSSTQARRLASVANTHLPATGGPAWTFAPVTTEAPLTVAAPQAFSFSAATANRPERQDSYFLTGLAIGEKFGPIGLGDLRTYSIPGGSVRTIENDNNNTRAFLHDTPPSMATNARGDTLAVWGQAQRCNTVTINSLKIVTAGADSGTPGIEPFISFQSGDGSEEQIWYWTSATNGGNDITSGVTLGPNAVGFPITRSFCAGATLRVYESDGPVNNPALNELVNFAGLTSSMTFNNEPLTFSGAGHTIELRVTIPLIDDDVIAGALLGADGQVKRTITFPTAPVPKSYKVGSQGAVVATNGDGFLVAYEAFTRSSSFGTGLPTVVVQAFDRDGNALGNAYRASGSTQNGQLTTNNVALAADWVGNSYRLVWQDRREPNIYMADVAANGAFITTPVEIFAGALTDGGVNYAPSIAYDPSRNRSLIVFLANTKEVYGLLYQGSTEIGTYLFSQPQFPQARSPQLAWHPGYQGWLLSYQDDTTPQRHVFVPLDANGNTAFPATTGFFLAATDNTLACPAVQTAPTIDLRLEELPGATAFTDTSGRSNTATCTGAACPTAGVLGAPNAPLSDYGGRFDGVNDRLTVNTAFADSYTVALWIKAEPGANNNAVLVDQGLGVLNGWGLYLLNGALHMLIGTNQLLATSSPRLDDGQWHFVAGAFNRATGAVAIYADGNPIPLTSGIATTGSLNAVSNLVIGGDRGGNRNLKGDMDHLQLYPTALAGDAVQALYNRTNQSYCLAAGVSNNNLYWAKVQANQQDTRGGRISASNGLTLTIDGDLPTAGFTNLPNGAVVAPGQVIGGSASDATSGVGAVEVSINNGAWRAATGANSWAFSLAGQSGAISLRVRAIDNVGNVGNPSAAINLTVDATAPILTINTPGVTLKPTKDAAGRWQVPLTGTANDVNGIQPASLQLLLTQQSGVGVAQSEQPATLSGSNWSSTYLLNDGLYDPTGAYTVTVQATDRVGNRATPATTVVRLDARGPEAVVNPAILARQVITPTLLINGVVSDTNSIAGIDKLEIAFTPIEQIAALPIGITSEQAEALLNRTWMPVTLTQRGTGVARTTWSFGVPAGLENSYQIDLRGFDMLGNVAISGNVWRGTIDTRIPRTALTATVTGVSYFDTARNQRMYEVRFLCGAQDRYLDEATFTCPGKGLVEPVRSFDSNPALQALFPDLTIRTGLALSYTLWMTSTTPAATVRACDLYGRCGTKSIGAAVAAGAAAAATAPVASAAPDGEIMERVEVGDLVQAAVVAAEASASTPVAVVVNPTGGSFVAAGNAISVTVAAEAGAGLKEVTIKLDNATVQTLSFAQSPAITRTVRTVNVPVATEGPHTLVAQATAWDNSTQSTLFPVVFTLDQNAPALTIDAGTLTLADAWVAQSGVLRFNGNASDSVGLAAVQIREGDNDFTDATFGNGTWRVALPIADPEGRTVNITVRAIDRAGRITQLTQTIATDLSAADAPDTSITSGPATPSTVNTAQFVFAGSATAVAFDCQLNEGAYTSCTSPTTYSDLSKGSHTFRVRAIDSRGLPDLSPAEFTWTVNATALDVTITNAPANPTSSRSATFAFSGNGASYECSLDGATFAACVSPAGYSGLSNGEHTFLVRARNGSNVGAAARYLWTVVNAPPVAASQTISTTQDKSVAITLRATDEDALTYRIVSQPDHGLLLGAPPALSYTPNTGFVGMDSFTFVASDGQSESAPTLVTINVGAPPPPTTANLTIVLDTQPNTGINQGFTGSLGNFALDDITPDDNDGIPNRRTFTVAPGSYLVRRSTPLTWVPTAIVCTPTTGAAIDLNGSSVTLALAAGDNATCTFTLARSVQLTARVFEDRVRTSTNLGKRNAGDPWLPGWTVTLFTAPGAPVATLLTEGTATAGLFEAVFRYLRPGAYMLCTTLSAGWTPTTPTAVDPAYGQPCKPVTLTGGQAALVLFGAYPPVVAAEGESFTPEEEVITDDDTISDLPEETTEAAPVEAPGTTPGAMVNQLFLPLAAR